MISILEMSLEMSYLQIGLICHLKCSNALLLEQVPYGARFAKIPGTESAENPQGLMVEVYWQQDDSGALCISGHSPETPLPPHAQQNKSYDRGATFSTASNHHIFSGGTSGPVQGIVLDPNQIMGSYSR